MTNRVSWPEVARCLNMDPKIDSTDLGPLAAAGFTPDNFDRLRASRGSVADMLSRSEDELELRAGTKSQTKRRAICAVRRRLETELWP